MTNKWAEDEAKLGFSGPPSEIGWADHEEIVAELNARRAYFRQQAEEWREEAIKTREELRQLREAAAFAGNVIRTGKPYESLDDDERHALDWLNTLLPTDMSDHR